MTYLLLGEAVLDVDAEVLLNGVEHLVLGAYTRPLFSST